MSINGATRLSTGRGKEETIGPTRELAQFVSRLQYDQLPPEVISKAKECVLDQLGVQLVAFTTGVEPNRLFYNEGFTGDPIGLTNQNTIRCMVRATQCLERRKNESREGFYLCSRRCAP